MQKVLLVLSSYVHLSQKLQQVLLYHHTISPAKNCNQFFFTKLYMRSSTKKEEEEEEANANTEIR